MGTSCPAEAPAAASNSMAPDVTSELSDVLMRRWGIYESPCERSLSYGRALDALPLRSQRLSRLSVVLASIQWAMSKPSPPSRGRSHRPESHEALEHSFLFRLCR